MTKQVHIHIHRTKARDAGEGKWITLSPSGTHVKVDGKGEITAGPKGMAGKKPSELASGPKQGEVGHSEHQKYGAYFKKGEQVRGPGGKVHEVFSHVGPAVETSGGRFHPTKVSKVAPTSVNQKAAAEMRTASAPDPIKQARQFEEQASKLHQQAQAEYQKNGPSDEHARLKREAQKATNQGTDLMVQAEAAARTSKPGPDGKPMGIHPALAAVTPPGFPTPGSQEGNKVRVNQATGELSMVGSSGQAQAKTEAPARPAVLEGVNAFDPPKSVSAKINAANVSYRSNTTGTGTAPKDKTQRGSWLFDSAPGSLADHSRTGATFAISGTYAEAEQKAKQQAAAWGHSQLRLAP